MAEVGYIFPNDAAKQVIDVGNAIKQTDDNLVKYSENAQKLIDILKQQNISFSQLDEAQKKVTETSKNIDAVGRQLIQSEQKLKQVEDARLKTIIENRMKTQEATKAIRDKVKAEQAEEGSLVRMRQRLAELTKEYDKSGTRTKEATKEINDLSREIGKAEAATNRHQRGVGGYADQLGNLPGPLGKVSSGIASVGKQMWALVANPIGAVIAALVLSVTALFKAFTSTDEGATMFASAMKALGNVVDVIMDRIASFGKLLVDIVTMDFEGMKKNGKEAFGGLADSIRDAAVAGWEYEQQMDRIKDRESASLTRAAKLRKEIEELTVASKDRNLGAKEQIRLAELAMKKSEELNKLEKGFAKERTEETLKDLASKISNDKLTNESKQNQLREWLEIDDQQLESALKKDKAFAEFYNKNEEDFQNLQKLRAEDIDNETQLVTETRRLQTSLFTFKKELYDADKKLRDERIAEEKKAADEIEKEQKKIADEYRKSNEQILEIESKRRAKQKAEEEENNEELFALEEDKLKRISELRDEQIKIDKEQEETEFQRRVEIYTALTDTIANGFYDFAQGNKDALKEAAKNVITIALEILKTQTQMAVAGATIQSLAQPDSIATFGVAGLARAAVLVGLIESAFAVVEGLVQGFAEGTDNAPSKFVAGEEGPELMMLRTGELMMVDKPTYFEGNKFKGATIKTNWETEQIISQSKRGNNFTFDTLDLKNELIAVRKAIQRKPVQVVDNSGMTIGKQTNGYREIYLNKLRNGR